MTWTLNGSPEIIDCGTGGCWNNVIDAPAAGTYSYSLTYNGNPVTGCSGSVTIAPALTCSVSPTTVNQNDSYTFTGAANINCWSCTYTWDNGSEGNHNPTDAITKVASTTGTKNLKLSCTCNNSFTGECTTPITINASGSGGGGSGSGADFTLTSKSDRVNIPAGTWQISINPGTTIYGCQFFCSGTVGDFKITIGSNTLSGNYYAGGSVANSICSGTSTITVNADATNCGFNYW